MVDVEAGKGLKSRLAAMGLVPGVEITMVSNGHPGPLVIDLRGSKMILGKGIAHKIVVR
jgi:Fe2+ transport system protein FeoA